MDPTSLKNTFISKMYHVETNSGIKMSNLNKKCFHCRDKAAYLTITHNNPDMCWFCGWNERVTVRVHSSSTKTSPCHCSHNQLDTLLFISIKHWLVLHTQLWGAMSVRMWVCSYDDIKPHAGKTQLRNLTVVVCFAKWCFSAWALDKSTEVLLFTFLHSVKSNHMLTGVLLCV